MTETKIEYPQQKKCGGCFQDTRMNWEGWWWTIPIEEPPTPPPWKDAA